MASIEPKKTKQDSVSKAIEKMLNPSAKPVSKKQAVASQMELDAQCFDFVNQACLVDVIYLQNIHFHMPNHMFFSKQSMFSGLAIILNANAVSGTTPQRERNIRCLKANGWYCVFANDIREFKSIVKTYFNG